MISQYFTGLAFLRIIVCRRRTSRFFGAVFAVMAIFCTHIHVRWRVMPPKDQKLSHGPLIMAFVSGFYVVDGC